MTVRKLSPTRASQTCLGTGAGIGLAAGATTAATGVDGKAGNTLVGAVTGWCDAAEATDGVTVGVLGAATTGGAEVVLGGITAGTGEAGGVHPVAVDAVAVGAVTVDVGVGVAPNITAARGVDTTTAGVGGGLTERGATGGAVLV